jgi:glycosyltransferase involved in cell wall biosynthesis
MGPEVAWLTLSVLSARLPDVATVQRTVRAARLDGPLPALCAALRDAGLFDATSWPNVEVVSGRVLIDLHHTARHLIATGIQRVGRESVRRWARDHDVMFIGWNEEYTSCRQLSRPEVEAVLASEPKVHVVPPSPTEPVIVPWKCTYLVPELPAEAGRTALYQALARFARSTTGQVGFDCVPLTASETTAEGMSAGFATYLASVAHVDRIATISEAAQLEYEGWRAMLAGAGLKGPDIHCVPLPVQASIPTDDSMAQARELLAIGSIPIVLSVGSHEPRKNHLALLHAAEVLWREGLLFSLVIVGGNSWNSAGFDAQVDELRQANRPVQTILALPDGLLWAAYRLAYCTVFASLHEGFGLPVAESLASGTPVITSNYGSMRELASKGGALLVDPRNDQSITDALRRMLTDRNLRDELAAQASKVPVRSWDDYAADLWAYLVEGAGVDRPAVAE